MTVYGITGTGAYAPELIIDNTFVTEPLGITAERAMEATGIRERRRAAPDEAPSDLGARAAAAALLDAGVGVDAIGLLIVATTTPDEIGSSTACRVQALLGAHRAVAFDVVAACTGYLFGLGLARDWLAAHPGEGLALVIGTETFSRFTDPADRQTALVFADGAGASVIGPVREGRGIEWVRLGSDGRRADEVNIPAGGSRRPADITTVEDRAHTVRMDAKAIRSAIPDLFGRLLADLREERGLTVDDLDLVVPHQPNPRTLRMYAESAGLDAGKFVINGERLGNTGAGSIPMALAAANAAGRLRDGDRVLMMAIGAGLTWGAVLMRWAADGKEHR